MAKLFKPKIVDDMTPAGLSARRREHWESREQAASLLRPKVFIKTLMKTAFKLTLIML